MALLRKYNFHLAFLCSALSIALHSQAQDNTLEVRWYKPEVKTSDRPGHVLVTILGSTSPDTQISISGADFPIVDQTGKVKIVKTKTISSKGGIFKADERGEFYFDIHLPPSEAQLPIEMKTNSGETRAYQLTLKITEDDVELANQKNFGISPYSRRTWSIWGGLGINYLKYDQETSIPSSITLESFDGPTLYGKIVRSLGKEFAFQVTANTAPGKTSSSSAISISEGSYNWTYLTGEFTFFPEKWRSFKRGRFSEWGLQWGAQYHIVPFIARSSTTNPATASVDTNEILLFAIGGTWLYHFGRYLLFETFFRYQVPYRSGSLFDVNYKMAFDGSAGIIYKWKPDWRVGAFWYGQMHNYNISNHKDVYFEANGGGGPNISGQQTLFYSNLELRIGYEFD